MSKSDKTKRRLADLFLALAVLCTCLTCFFSLHRRTVIMDYRMPDLEINAVPVPGIDVPGTELEDGMSGGFVTYSNRLVYDAQTGTLSLNFQNPSASPTNMVLRIDCEGETVYESGVLQPGYGLTTVPGLSFAKEAGEYPCTLEVTHYDARTGEKAIFKLEAEATLVVEDFVRFP